MSHRIGLPALQRAPCGGAEARRCGHVADEVDHPAGVDHAHHDRREQRLEAVEVGLAADQRERAAVDLGAVPDVLGHDARDADLDVLRLPAAALAARPVLARRGAVAHGGARGGDGAHVEQRLRARAHARARREPCPARVGRDDEPGRRERRPASAAASARSTSSSVSVRQGESRTSPPERPASARSDPSESGSSRASGGSAVTATRPSF